MGSFFAFKGVFDSKGVSDMGKLVYHISLPCLLFSKILYEFTVERLHLLWILPFSCFLHVTSGFVVGEVFGRLLCVQSNQERRVGIASTMFGNVGALAIAVLDSLCHSESLASLAGSQQECSSIAISYIAFYLITQNLLMFTWGESLMVSLDDDPEPRREDPGLCEAGDPEASEGAAGGSGSARTSVATAATEDVEITEEDETGGMHTRRRTSTEESPSEDYLCRVSPYPPPHLRDSARVLFPGSGGLTRRSTPLTRPSYTIKLGHDGLKKVQSHLALECDHSLAVEMGSSPTHKLRDTIEQYLHYISSSKEDLQRERFLEEGGAPPGMANSEGGDPRDGGGDSMRQALLGTSGGEVGGDGGEEVKSPIKRAATFVYTSARRVKSTYTSVTDWILVLLVRLARTPALQAAVSAIFLASIPALKSLLIISGSDSTKVPPLYFVYDAFSTLGQAQVPVSMLMLSGTATLRYMKGLRKKAIKMTVAEAKGAEGEGDPDTPQGQKNGHQGFSASATTAILLGRTLLMPFVGLGWWWCLNALKLVPDIQGHTPIMQLVILVESAVPTAQNVVMLLLVHGRLEQGESLAQLVLIQMAISVVTFTVSCSFFQWLVIPMA
ncbi:auxin efflux carrier [Chloropicon primus]|nr:auxin efflux carrier [Chloropicon primus]